MPNCYSEPTREATIGDHLLASLADPCRRRLLSAAIIGLTSSVFAASSHSAMDSRRLSADQRCRLAGPARAHPAMLTTSDRWGQWVHGPSDWRPVTQTPWGSTLACEANIKHYLQAPRTSGTEQSSHGSAESDQNPDGQKSAPHSAPAAHPNEANRFGWIVEIDPRSPTKSPVKRTALGRFKHGSASLTLAQDGRLVVYLGDGGALEHVYKYVSHAAYLPGLSDTDQLLDDGTLYVARFDDNGKGQWLPLRHGERYPGGALAAENGFHNQGDVVIRCRQAAAMAMGSKINRLEWIAVSPLSRDVFISLSDLVLPGKATQNHRRPIAPEAEQARRQIIRWREYGQNAGSISFTWQRMPPQAGARDV